MKPKTISLLVVAVLFGVILAQNSDRTFIELFFWRIEMPLFILIVSTLFLGWVVGWFTHLAYQKGRAKVKSATPPPEPKAAPQSQTEPSDPSSE
ncbi:MAG: LapA family protein [Calditrichaeota bacterium]|nr:MAG: LapA family protein [Calditrichota bacterium]